MHSKIEGFGRPFPFAARRFEVWIHPARRISSYSGEYSKKPVPLSGQAFRFSFLRVRSFRSAADRPYQDLRAYPFPRDTADLIRGKRLAADVPAGVLAPPAVSPLMRAAPSQWSKHSAPQKSSQNAEKSTVFKKSSGFSILSGSSSRPPAFLPAARILLAPDVSFSPLLPFGGGSFSPLHSLRHTPAR